jgi:Zn-dependent peptidase ImmA (M78 family)/DNA-binding XRE family transcriptional regulator
MEPRVIGGNIRRLRASKKLSQKILAEKAGISRVTLSRIEKGEYQPRVSTLEKLASALECGLERLLEEVPPLAEVRFRALKKHNERDQIIADIARKLENYHKVEELVADRREFKFSGLPANLRDDPVRLAQAVREAAGLDVDEPIRDICGMLENAGIKLIRICRATDAFFGLSVASERFGPAIVVNTWEKISVERWIFTAAHELGHLLMHSRAYVADQIEENLLEEKAADKFAAHLLMPDVAFRPEWENAIGLPLLDRVFKVKRMFRVSWGTVLYRLLENNEADDSIWAVFRSRYRERYGKKLGGKDEPRRLDEDDFYGGIPVSRGIEREELSVMDFREDRLSRLVRRAFQSGKVSLGWAAEVLDVSRKDMRRLASEWAES